MKTKAYIVIVEKEDPDGYIRNYAVCGGKGFPDFSREMGYILKDKRLWRSNPKTPHNPNDIGGRFVECGRGAFIDAQRIARHVMKYNKKDGVIKAKVFRVRSKNCPVKVNWTPRDERIKITKEKKIKDETHFPIKFKEGYVNL